MGGEERREGYNHIIRVEGLNVRKTNVNFNKK